MTNRPARQIDAAQNEIEPHRRFLARLLCGHGAADCRAAGSARILAAPSHRNADLGPACDVVRCPYRLYRHGLLRAFGLLRTRHVWRGGGALDRQPAQSVARHSVRARRGGGRGAVRCLFLHAPARHLLRHHYADLLADLLCDNLHLDQGDRRRERADLLAPAFHDPVPL